MGGRRAKPAEVNADVVKIVSVNIDDGGINAYFRAGQVN